MRQTPMPIPDAHPVSDFDEFPEHVTDKKTGLSWAKAWFQADWPTAMSACTTETYGGMNDWRLPTEGALVSLVDYTKHSPASSVPNLSWALPPSQKKQYWSTTASGSGTHWGVYMYPTGETNSSYADSVQDVARCVRQAASTPKTGIEQRFAVPDDGATLLDRISGLCWQRTLSTEELIWKDAVSARPENIGALPGGGWRLPAIGELRQLNTRDPDSSAIYFAAFDTANSWDGRTATLAWSVGAQRTFGLTARWNDCRQFGGYLSGGGNAAVATWGLAGVHCVR